MPDSFPPAPDPLAAWDTFVGQAHQATVDDARAAATSVARPATSVQQAEIAWAKAHDGGGIDPPLADVSSFVDLWNFDVGDATLKPEHIQALNRLTLYVRGLLANSSQWDGWFVATGYASKTGGSTENGQLADARAQAVASWLQQNIGVGIRESVIITSGWPGMPAGDSSDPATLARNRSVRVERTDPPPPKAPDPSAPPSFSLVTLKPGAPPTVLKKINEVTFKSTLPELTLWKMPPDPPEELMGEIKLGGELQLTCTDVNQADGLKAALELGKEGVAGELEGEITKRVKAVLNLTPARGEEPSVVAVGAEIGEDLPWKIQLQGKLAFVHVEKTFAELPLGEFTIDALGITVSMRLEGKVTGDIGPGPGLLRRFGLESAAEAEEAGVAAGVALADVGAVVMGALTAIVITYLVVTSQSAGQQHMIDQTTVMADRAGFAARTALDVSGATRDKADAWLAGWSNTADFTRQAVGAGYSRADSEIKSLITAGTYDSTIKQLTAAYIHETGKKNLVYEDVANWMYDVKFGGVNMTGPTPSISVLLQ